MDRRELNRMFDALAPAPGREAELLDGLLRDGKRRKNPVKNWKRMAVALAAAVLLVGTAAAAHYVGVSIVDNREENGLIEFTGGMTYYSADQLSDEVKTFESAHSGDGGQMKKFASWDEMEEFIGVDLMNSPLLNASPATEFFEKWMRDEQTVSGQFILDVYPGLTILIAHGCYEVGDASIVVDSYLFTDKYEKRKGLDEFIYGLGFNEGTEVNWEPCTTSGGRQAQVLTEVFPEDHTMNDGLCVGAVSLNGIPTLVRVYGKGSVAESHAVLMQVLDSFQ